MTEASPPRRRGRPPKLHTGFLETRTALTRAGVVALAEKGFPSTAIEEILTSCNVPKGSFYHYFDSKETFGRAVIESYAQYFARRLDSFLLNDAFAPLDRLRAFTLDAQAAMQRHDYRRGCLVGNLGQEMGAIPESYRQQLIGILEDWQQRTCTCLAAAQAAGAIAASHDCRKLAEYFWIGWEGAVLRAKLERRSAPLAVFSQHFFSFIEN